MSSNRITARISSGLFALSFLIGTAAHAEDVKLMEGLAPRPGDARQTKVDEYKKPPPWKIGFSLFGVNANTWTVQAAREASSAAAKDKRISNFILLDANLNQAKQVADIEDLIAQKVNAIIITPVTTTSADAGIKKAVAAGIPVIIFSGLTDTDAFTVDMQGGGVHYGKVMGDFLVKKLGGKGNIWVLRGVPAHPEEVNRYKGLQESLKGTQVKIVQEDYGQWQYDGGKKVCETFYLNNPQVDGIWSSGADMSRACIDVLKEMGAKVPPITAEGNNGFFGQVAKDNIDSIAAEFGPQQGAAAVRAAVALLEGKSLYHRYVYQPDGWDLAKMKKYYRPDLSANMWFPTNLSEQDLQKFYGVKNSTAAAK